MDIYGAVFLHSFVQRLHLLDGSERLLSLNFSPSSQCLLRNVPEGRCDRSLARNAWDRATPKEPSRRVRCDSRRCAHRFDDGSDKNFEYENRKISAWIHQTFPDLRNFAWQRGYGAFSVGIWQARSITSSSSSNIIGHEPFKSSI